LLSSWSTIGFIFRKGWFLGTAWFGENKARNSGSDFAVPRIQFRLASAASVQRKSWVFQKPASSLSSLEIEFDGALLLRPPVADTKPILPAAAQLGPALGGGACRFFSRDAPAPSFYPAAARFLSVNIRLRL
jgi:hypothetical protein